MRQDFFRHGDIHEALILCEGIQWPESRHHVVEVAVTFSFEHCVCCIGQKLLKVLSFIISTVCVPGCDVITNQLLLSPYCSTAYLKSFQ